MASREPIQTRSRASRASTPPPEPGAAATPMRRSQRLQDRTAKSTGGTPPDGEAPESLPAPPPLAKGPLRRAVSGRRSALRPAKRARCSTPELTGLWELLPNELLDMVLERCGPRQLGRLEASCKYFKNVRRLDEMCYERLKAVPRAKGMEPNRSANESWASTLFFINSQSNAAAQATALSLGHTHSAALLVPNDGKDGDHNLYTFGRGFNGELGHEDFDNSSAPKHLCIGYQACMEHPQMEEEITPAVVTCGSSHTACITRRGMLYTFGLGKSGELGLGAGSSAQVSFPERAYLHSKPHLRIVSIACGTNHTLAISEVGTLWACGYNAKGQLGIGNLIDSCELRPLFGALRGFRVVAAAAGVDHSVALSSDGSLFTGAFGQLGQPQLQDLHAVQPHNPLILDHPRKIDALDPFKLQPWKRITAIASGKHHCMAVTVGGDLLAFGRNKCGQLGLESRNCVWVPTVVPLSWTGESSAFFRTSQVACGSDHTMALVMHRGKLVPCVTGANSFGQLGLGDQIKRWRFTPIRALARADISTLQCGDYNSGAIGGDGCVYLWGRNDHGQLGLGDTRSRWVPTVLHGFTAVHPDRTLRKNKRSLPRMRPIAAEEPAGGGAEARISDALRAFFPATSKQIEAGAAPPRGGAEQRGAEGAGPGEEGAAAAPPAAAEAAARGAQGGDAAAKEPSKQEGAAAAKAETRADSPAE
ncbi:ultraviolet-B receptor-like [Raphidocelis subcapitata]|uniref:Ultraviolet-B receptor-like n=1 Tax=Raphidocelis subcapitata TaxID=307507 RepID=A0A2V0NUU2_9CHLO|nr:ultraviolet-B receptor-like [Raphidocelis subcapitata]|eukprot:GBF91109.1 ultraviolet-B receptor-like [Raphidocelis subcapitata]